MPFGKHRLRHTNKGIHQPVGNNDGGPLPLQSIRIQGLKYHGPEFQKFRKVHVKLSNL